MSLSAVFSANVPATTPVARAQRAQRGRSSAQPAPPERQPHRAVLAEPREARHRALRGRGVPAGARDSQEPLIQGGQGAQAKGGSVGEEGWHQYPNPRGV